MAQPANCPRCGKLFMKGPQIVCETCRRKEEDDFQLVYKFIRQRDNRTATVEEISAATEVSEEQIRRFVKEKRLHPANFPSLSYECERCGTLIQEGRLCNSCNSALNEGIQRHDRDKRLDEQKEQMVKETARKNMTYVSVNKDKK